MKSLSPWVSGYQLSIIYTTEYLKRVLTKVGKISQKVGEKADIEGNLVWDTTKVATKSTALSRRGPLEKMMYWRIKLK